MWAYAEQHIPELKKVDGGRCIGFAVTLAKSIAENTLDSRRSAVDKLLALERDLLAGKPVPKDPELDSFISAVMKNHGNKFAGPVIVAGEFDDAAFIEACAWLKNPGETLVFGSNYEDSKRETHAIAISLMRSDPRTYCLIDANGTAPIVLGGSVASSLAGVTTEILLVPKFIKKALGLQKEMVTSIHFLSFDTVPRVPDIDRNEFYRKHVSDSEEKINKISLRVLNQLEAKDEEKSYYNLVPTELMEIAKTGHTLKLMFLIEIKKKSLSRQEFMDFLDQKNSRGQTALEFAIHYNHFGCVQMLCEAGAEWDLERKNGEIKLPPGEISDFFQKLRTHKRYVQEFDLFARFLNTRFEEAKLQETIAKECRIYLLELALLLLGNLGNSPREVERVRKTVARCKFMHHSPKTSLISFSFKTGPKYPTCPEEGALITSSLFKEYGTHHSTHLFYKMCDSLVNGDNETLRKLSSEIRKLYPQVSIESYHIKTIRTMEEFNFYSSIPELKSFGDKLLWINCLRQKISLTEEDAITSEALSLINIIYYRGESSLQIRLEELLRLKVMLKSSPFPVTLKIMFFLKKIQIQRYYPRKKS